MELGLLAGAAVAVVVLAGWTLDRLGLHDVGTGASARLAVERSPDEILPDGAGRLVRINGVLMERLVLPLDADVPPRDLERLVRGSAWWRTPLFPSDPAARQLESGVLDGANAALVGLQASGGAQRARSAQVLDAGGRRWLVLLRTLDDLVSLEHGQAACRLDPGAALGDMQAPDGWRPLLFQQSADGTVATSWFVGPPGRRPGADWPRELARQGWAPGAALGGQANASLAGTEFFKAGSTCRLRWSADNEPQPWCALERSAPVTDRARKRG
jgi:hypothetical protein